jgi:hypothetical protein
MGLLYIRIAFDSTYEIRTKNSCNCILEVIEIFNDKTMSKVKVVNVAYNKSDKKFKSINFNPWVESTDVYWISPSTPVDRDNKLKKILN